MHGQPNHYSIDIAYHKVLTYVTSLVSDITMKMHAFLADLRIDSPLFTFFFALGRYSHRETKQCGLTLKGLFQKCMGEKIDFHRVIRKQIAYALILLVC